MANVCNQNYYCEDVSVANSLMKISQACRVQWMYLQLNYF